VIVCRSQELPLTFPRSFCEAQAQALLVSLHESAEARDQQSNNAMGLKIQLGPMKMGPLNLQLDIKDLLCPCCPKEAMQGVGPVHVFMLVSAPICIFMAGTGQLHGCSPSMQDAGFGSGYQCNDNETQLFFVNNMWQVTIWATFAIATLHKPHKRFMALLFMPFLLMALAISSLVSAFVWFCLFGIAYCMHSVVANEQVPGAMV